MPLDIKQLFVSDLNPNQLGWWSTDKIDKLNHNFNLLSDGGMKGPQGVPGISGATGPKGQLGDQGVQGANGFQGFAGVDANLNWTHVDGPTNRTIYPMIEGDDLFGVALTVGANNQLAEYNFPNVYNNTSQYKVITAQGVEQLNFRFGELSYDALFDGQDLFLGKLSMGPAPLYVTDELNNSIRDYYIGERKILSISDDLIESKELTQLDNVYANQFAFKNEAETSRILTAIDANGNVAWRNKAEVLSVLPIGSIVSIPENYFNNSNFHIDSAFEVIDGILNLFWGRGRQNTAYEGWYICNGEDWNYLGNNLFEVPNLNSFTYNIDSNGGNQPNTAGGNNTPIIIGGADTSSESTFNAGTSNFQTDLTVDVTDITDTFDSGSGFYVSRNIHIINLGSPYLTWATVGTGVITEAIVLGYGSTTSESACAAPNGNFLWNTSAAVTDWSDINEDFTGVIIYDTNNNLAQANRWYERDGIARYWNGTSFTNAVVCPLVVSIDLETSDDVTDLNGLTFSSGTYTINANFFAGATTLKLSGSNAAAGWYRDGVGTSTGVRRYWDGSAFRGETINTTYVYYAGPQEVSYSNSSSACQFTDAYVKIYYATNNIVAPSSNVLQDIWSNSGVVYVHLNWTGTATGEFPLVKIYSQNGSGGGSTPYKSILTDASTNVYRSTITTGSMLLQPVICADYTISGTTTATPGNNDVSGFIHVTNAPVSITLQSFGGAGGSYCYTNATLNITGVGQLYVFANAYMTTSDTISITSNGTFSYTLFGDFGCSSGNSATIS